MLNLRYLQYTGEEMYQENDTFLVEIRLARTKWRIKSYIRTIAEMFRLTDCMELHPHITLYGPFTLSKGSTVESLVGAIDRAVSPYSDPIPFTIAGCERRDGLHGGVIAFGVLPSPTLIALTRSLSQELSAIAISINLWDNHPDHKWFHVTIANRIDRLYSLDVFSRIQSMEKRESRWLGEPWNRFRSLIRGIVPAAGKPATFPHPVFLDDAGMRITIMHGQEILAEYDLISRRWLTGDNIGNRSFWRQSMTEYRLRSGFELRGAGPPREEEIFAIADLHFGHANIIRYCSRPFEYEDVKEMDEILVENWNYTVGRDHRIFFCGDLCYGNGSRPASDYLSRLNGRITCIPGNHDANSRDAPKYQVIECEGLSFCLIHDPEQAPKDFNGWIIHGHHHNNDLENFPFFHPGRRRINVSAEVVGFTPVPLSELARLIHEKEGDPEAIVHLRYPYTKKGSTV